MSWHRRALGSFRSPPKFPQILPRIIGLKLFGKVRDREKSPISPRRRSRFRYLPNQLTAESSNQVATDSCQKTMGADKEEKRIRKLRDRAEQLESQARELMKEAELVRSELAALEAAKDVSCQYSPEEADKV